MSAHPIVNPNIFAATAAVTAFQHLTAQPEQASTGRSAHTEEPAIREKSDGPEYE
jgi:hypothetical protein